MRDRLRTRGAGGLTPMDLGPLTGDSSGLYGQIWHWLRGVRSGKSADGRDLIDRSLAESPACDCSGPWTVIPNLVRTQHDRPDEDLHGPYTPTPPRRGSESPGDLSPGNQRDGPVDG